jgi:hypothetical protein
MIPEEEVAGKIEAICEEIKSQPGIDLGAFKTGSVGGELEQSQSGQVFLVPS